MFAKQNFKVDEKPDKRVAGGIPPTRIDYYLQKLSHDFFGIVNISDDSSAVYIFNERISPKNMDHSVSYLTHYLCNKVPPWVQRIHPYMDNACSKNKNYYSMGWVNELVQQVRFNISFLIVGHRKFAPDLLFSKIFQRSDVFT